MKKLLISMLVSLTSFMQVHNIAFTSDLALSEEIANNYIARREQQNQIWQNKEIVDSTELYDLNMDFIGYVHDLSDSGYIISLKVEDTYLVVEAAPMADNPYSEYDGRKIYQSFNNYYEIRNDNQVYYVNDSNETLVDNTNLVTIPSISEQEILNSVEFDENSLYSINSLNDRSTTYISNFSTKFTHIFQGTGNSYCTPTAAAMIARYYANSGKITLNYANNSSGNSNLKVAIATAMGNPDGEGVTLHANVVSGFKNFIQSHCAKTISGESFGINRNTFLNEINNSRPMIITSYQGVTHATSVHSTTAVGYIAEEIDVGAPATVVYMLLSDPGTSSSSLKEVIYNASNVWFNYKFTGF